MFYFFFFSSRRRHTRYWRDWSSDVCSSDLIEGMGLEKQILVHARSGDTKASERAKFRRSGAHILVTTPESLAVMLAQQDYVRHLHECQFVIVDELHSFAGNKRGADLTLSLERLERLCSRRAGAGAGARAGHS